MKDEKKETGQVVWYVTAVVRGIGQVMLQRSVWAGVLMLAGLAVGAWQMALAALAGSGAGIACARLIGCDRQDVGDGLYGFNGALVGLAVAVYFSFSAMSVSLLFCGVFLATGLTRWFVGRQLPGLTAPFILSVWLLLAMRTVLMVSGGAESSGMMQAEPEVTRALALSWAQVMFEGSCLWTGALFFMGVLVGSPLKALYGIAAAALPFLLAWCPEVDVASVNDGLLGYNAVLCGIALGERTWCSAWWTLFAVVLSVILQVTGMHAGVPTLTAPFVLSVWMTMGVRRYSLWIKRLCQSEV